jgi:hypothetical protein
MNRRTLDIAIPMLFALAILITVFTVGGAAVGAVAVIGGVLVGMYFAAIRRNLRS